MNYDHLNQIHEYWVNKIFPNLHHYMPLTSFEDYLKRMSFIPSGKWLSDMESVKILRVPFVVDPSSFSEMYKKHCVAYGCPAKPEDGVHRIVYQISPTLHAEGAVWIWIESKQVQSYMSLLVCFKEEKELKTFLEHIGSIKRRGDTEDNPNKGFAGMIDGFNIVKGLDK